MSRRELQSFRWNGTQWISVTSSFHLEDESKLFITTDHNSNLNLNESIRIATFNILADCFPWFIEIAIRSPERFEWLCKGIRNLNPTIIGLNEVTPTALNYLQQCPFIRENYFITESINETNDDDSSETDQSQNGLLSPHGCIILSKLPFLEVFAIQASGSKREAVVGKVQLGNSLESCVYVCARHTTAYQIPKNAQLRAQQIRNIVDVLEPIGIPFLIMGDLNLHYQFEDSIVVDNNLIDAWAQTHFSNIYPFNDKDQGYTFDSVKNSLIPYYIPGECRQMRLDRILFSHGFPAFAVKPCVLWANEPINSDNYLFPSDHFGLSIDFIINTIDDNRVYMPLGEPDSSVQEILSCNAQKNKDQSAYRLGFVQRTVAFASHILWLGAVMLRLK